MATFLMLSTTVAFADTISDKKKELQDVNENIEKAKGEIAKVKNEQTETMNQIAEIELDLKEKEEQLMEIEASLDALQESIELTEKELQEAIAKADLHKELMDERMCAMYMSSGTTHLEVLFDAKSITDFIDRVVMVREIMSLDKDVFDEMQEIAEEIEMAKESLEEQKAIEEGTQKDLETQKALIEEKREEKEALFAKLEEQQKKMEDDLGKLEKTSKELKSTIQRLVAERQAEQERRIRAQAAAAAQTSRGSRSGAPSSASSNKAPVNVSGGSNALVAFARAQKGKNYKWGAVGPNSFDCSGFACYVYKNFGVNFQAAGYRTSAAQASMPIGTKITSKSDLRPGDLVFFAKGGRVNHVGIYTGNGTFVHAQNAKSGVIESSLNSGSYSRRFVCGRRIIQ